MSAAIEEFAALVPTPRAIMWGQRVRRVWAELTRAQAAGEAMPSMRQLAERCRLPSSSTAQTCVEALVANGAVVVVARQAKPNALGTRRRVTSALRVVRMYGWECML